MTRQEFNNLPSDIYQPYCWWPEIEEDKKREEYKKKFFEQPACPDCGQRSTHPTPGCDCPGHPHIMLNHHTCNL